MGLHFQYQRVIFVLYLVIYSLIGSNELIMAIHKTPLRYPGGKQKLAPFIREILKQNGIQGHYVEPYAGGAGVAIEYY